MANNGGNTTKCNRLNKLKLIELLFTGPVVIIQRAAKQRARYRPINTIDPITQSDLGKCPFLLISSKGIITGFDANMLRICIETTHCALNPITQDPINAAELHRLSKRTGGKMIKINPAMKNELEIHMSLCTALERQVGYTVQSFLDAIEDESNAAAILNELMYVQFLPELVSSVSNYVREDRNGCIHILDHCIQKACACRTTSGHELEITLTILKTVKDNVTTGDYGSGSVVDSPPIFVHTGETRV